MSRQTRRTFLKKSAAAGVAFSTFTISGTKSSGRVIGANDTIRAAICGLRGRGGAHVGAFVDMPNVQVTRLIDVDGSQFDRRIKQVQSKAGNTPTCVRDIREALDDKSVDVVSIATCNHTHALYTVWSCQAGKDVYVEKPLSHNVFEGRKCVDAARKYNRVVQHGTQQRSSQRRANEIATLHSGKYGKLLVSKGYCCKPRWSIGWKQTKSPPERLDLNLWLGPAAEQPYHENLVHYNWHWFWDFGNGDTGNQGVHEMDVARWAIPGATLPKRVWSLGGRFGYRDQGETPNTQLSVFDFGEALLIFETRGLVGKYKGFDRRVANEYYTTEGMITGCKFYPHGGGKPERLRGPTARQVTPGGAFGSFITAVRTRQREDNNADVEVGHYSAALCHLGNISYRLGRQVPFLAKSRSLGDNKQVVEAFETVKANCRAVGMDLQESTYRLGPTLDFDPVSEKFIDTERANGMLTRDYRFPFVVPNEV